MDKSFDLEPKCWADRVNVIAMETLENCSFARIVQTSVNHQSSGQVSRSHWSIRTETKLASRAPCAGFCG
jgi:hypothetical protein